MISETELRQNTIYVNLYVVWSKIIFIEIIPYFAILIMNIFIITKITKSTRFRRKFQRQYPDPDVAVTGSATVETNLSHNGRRLWGLRSPSRALNVPKQNGSIGDIEVQTKPDQKKMDCNRKLEIKCFEKTNGKEKLGIGENQPFLHDQKPTIEIESPTNSEHNSKGIDGIENSQNGEKEKIQTKADVDGPLSNRTNIIQPTPNSFQKKTSSASLVECPRLLTQRSTQSELKVPFGRGSKNGKKKPQQKTFLRKQQEEHSLGIILILMSILFVICQSLKIVPDMYEIIVCKHSNRESEDEPKFCDFPDVINKLTQLSHLLVCINSSANFLIYYCAGGKFREAWLETYGFWWCCCSRTDLRSLIKIPWMNRNQSTTSSHVSMNRDISLEETMTPSRKVQTLELSPIIRKSKKDSLICNDKGQAPNGEHMEIKTICNDDGCKSPPSMEFFRDEI